LSLLWSPVLEDPIKAIRQEKEINFLITLRTVLPKVWSLTQQHQHHSNLWQKYTFWSPKLKPLESILLSLQYWSTIFGPVIWVLMSLPRNSDINWNLKSPVLEQKVVVKTWGFESKQSWVQILFLQFTSMILSKLLNLFEILLCYV
jgi:hypothetical protein